MQLSDACVCLHVYIKHEDAMNSSIVDNIGNRTAEQDYNGQKSLEIENSVSNCTHPILVGM